MLCPGGGDVQGTPVMKWVLILGCDKTYRRGGMLHRV